MFTPRKRQELIELWLLANDGAATSEQLERLSQWIAAEPEAREFVVELTGHQGWLAWNAANLRPAPAIAALSRSFGDDAAAVRSAGFKSAHGGRAGRRWLPAAVREAWYGLSALVAGRRRGALAMIAIACVAGYFVGHRSGNELAVRGVDAGGESAIRATMISSTGCIWGPGNTVKRLVDERFASGDALQLLEGLAELQIGWGPTDVRLQLEGPASAVLTAQGTPSVSYGKIVVKTAGPRAAAYPLETSFGRVLVEPSAEVGLIVFGSSAEVHCFSGRAIIESPWLKSNDEEPASVAIEAGESLQFEDVGGATLAASRGAADKERFTPQVSMSTDFLSVSPEYVREVVAAKPVAYWRFEDASGDVARNEMGDGYYCQVKGDVGRVGPRGNRALELGFAVQPGSVVAGESWDEVLSKSFSIEVWMKPNHYHQGSIVGFVGEFDPALHRNKHGVLVETCGPSGPSDWLQPKQLRFLHRSQLTADPKDGVSCFSGRSYEARRWQHVVAVKDGGELRLYLDGALVQTARDDLPTPQGLHLVIGQLYTETVERFFIGQVDEVAIYDRPLEEQEVRRHHELLRPSQPDEGRSI